MDEEILRAYIEAGRIAKMVREEAAKRIQPGLSVYEFCTWVENRIVELGGKPAFPCNLSINDVAAHYSPLVGDELLVPEDSVVKIDLGVHVDGYIADTAVTVSFSDKWSLLLEAVRSALDKAISAIAPGVKFSEIGRIIEATITSYGFKPISNLGGHSLARYTIHAGESIPNVYEPFLRGKFGTGKAYAIEPFGTNGAGSVKEGDLVTIYALVRPNLKRRLNDIQRRVLNTIRERFRTLPFSERWLTDVAPIEDIRNALRRLSRMGFLAQYPVLVEKGGGMVAQFEHTIVITDSGDVIVTTM
ncbi:type II methionyl aminopeptidase [Pyrofollis japonicus]|uniref:type II methionyl aminopeptidase n=1 Tax=Pyrofollis japonicus TaxID=3060460 RepID=UPI00295C0AB7|nr:type II methionyl aminopeptidase [Pyrofollis japonicus]BEP17045.1 type II methionyl aminopeptidase [Pyrofollis japonicus]